MCVMGVHWSRAAIDGGVEVEKRLRGVDVLRRLCSRGVKGRLLEYEQ